MNGVFNGCYKMGGKAVCNRPNKEMPVAYEVPKEEQIGNLLTSVIYSKIKNKKILS